ncbi:uncharacterized protein [Amphiura filiformis]|uniref:uncharacterized protein n=1 Tax=Amphiura filiformis TaxID=82378 RepID=UPI003B21FE66
MVSLHGNHFNRLKPVKRIIQDIALGNVTPSSIDVIVAETPGASAYQLIIIDQYDTEVVEIVDPRDFVNGSLQVMFDNLEPNTAYKIFLRVTNANGTVTYARTLNVRTTVCYSVNDEECAECADGFYRCATGICIPEEYLCDNDNDCEDNSDEYLCGNKTDCPDKETRLSTNASVTIQSPGYPTYYPNDIQCNWNVTPSATRRILVQFLDFKTEQDYDILYVGTLNNRKALSYSGYDTSDALIISPINETLLFEFSADYSGTRTGFSIVVTDVANEDCPDEVTELSLNGSVAIQSPGYPGYYHNNIRCEWTVIPTPMRRVRV